MKAFVPIKLPFKNLKWESFINNLGPANRSIARFDGLLQSIPNPAVLLSPLTTREAVLSSKIEGTQATLEEVLKFEADPRQKTTKYQDIREVINYRRAINYSVEELKKRSITLSLLKDTHSILLENVRGEDKKRGAFREIQNWIGKPGSTMDEARFIPPSPLILNEYLDNFEEYLELDDSDTLVQVAIAHAQFEILHPFVDGNGRIGRIIIPLFLYSKKVLHTPMFYISGYLETNREEYYNRLKDITDNNSWEEWINFFLNAITIQSKENIDKARQILELYNSMKQKIVESTHSQYALQALDALFMTPVFSTTNFQNNSNIPKPSSARIINSLREEKIITTIKEGRGNQPSVHMFDELLQIVSE